MLTLDAVPPEDDAMHLDFDDAETWRARVIPISVSLPTGCGSETLMSKGPGRIERAIRTLFDANPELAFATVDLVEHCFPGVSPGTAERKHSVSVLCAAFKVIADDPDWNAWRINGQGRGWVFVNHASVPSYAMAECIVGNGVAPYYRSPKRALRHAGGPRRRWVMDKEVPALQKQGVAIERLSKRRVIRGFLHPAGAYAVTLPPFERFVMERPQLHEVAAERAAYQRIKLDVAWHIAHRDGDTARIEALKTEIDEFNAEAAAKGRLLGAKIRAGTGLATDEDKRLLLSASLPDGQNGNAPLIDGAILLHRLLHELPDRIRRAAALNDPDAQRVELAAITADLDELRDLFNRIVTGPTTSTTAPAPVA